MPFDRGVATASEYNSLAWLLLVRGLVGEEAAQSERAPEHAMRAVQESNAQDYSILHTLASLYAELGRNDEAHDTLVQALDVKYSGAVASHDCYVLGRIAENIGLVDAARKSYAKVRKPERESDLATSTYALAQGRLARLPRK
jgi:tetratricopeptide (TPR) repeat protein